MSGSSFMMSRVRVAMILHGALMMGVMGFGGIMAMLARAPGRSPGMVMNPPYLAELLAWGACSLGIVAAVVLRRVRVGLEGMDEARRVAQWFNKIVISAAIMEGGALLACVLTLLTGDLTLLGAPLMVVVAMGLLFPTPERCRDWIR